MDDLIPIKGYATFDPLKHCWVGSGFNTEMFEHLDIYKNDRIMDPLKRIIEETEEDYQKLEKILQDAGVKTYREFLPKDIKIDSIYRPPVCPRDHFAVVGEKFYYVGPFMEEYNSFIPSIDPAQLIRDDQDIWAISTAVICRVGKDLFFDCFYKNDHDRKIKDKYVEQWRREGFRVHVSHRGYHSDGVFCVVKPGCIVSLNDVQDYATEFPGWDVLYLPDQSWSKVDPFMKMKDKVGGQWWLKGEEHNDELIQFVNTWLNDWVGYVEETVFDVNMLSIDQNTIICNNYNKTVFDHFKKHKVEPIIFNFRHRYFWDGGIHCITQDLYREGTQVDYFG